MISSNLPPSTANLFASYQPIGVVPVGQEDASLRSSTFKPVEELSSSAGTQLRTTDNRVQSEPFPANPFSATSDPADSTGSDPGSAAPTDDQAASDQTQPSAAAEKRKLERDQQDISRLASRDREVRAHEQAHASVGGLYAGAAQYQYQRGPDGVRYAVSGEVPINVGRESSPEATLQKMAVVKRAALAPAEPSPQDRRVAAEASRLEAQARRELSIEQTRSDQSAETESTAEETATDEVGAVESAKAAPEAPEIAAPEPPVEFVRTGQTILSSELQRVITNTSLSSRQPGDLLDQLA